MHPALEEIKHLILRYDSYEDSEVEVEERVREWWDRWFESLTALSLIDTSLAVVVNNPTEFRVKQDEFQLRGLLDEVVFAGPEKKVVHLRDLGKVTALSEEGRSYEAFATEISATFLRHAPKD